MLRCLFIQQLYGLSNEQLERELAFRERLADSGVDTEIWYALQKQLDAMKLKVEMGIMQDTSFMTSDPDHAKSDTPREEKAKTRRHKILFRIQASWGHPLSYEDEMRNKRISSKRSPVERYFAFTKRICNAGYVAVTTIGRVRVKMIITGIYFSLYHLTSAKSKIQA